MLRPASLAHTPGAARGRQGEGRWAKPHGREPAVMAGLTDAEAAALVALARGRSVLEVGSAWGYSTILMACVARYVVAVDPHVDLQSLDTFTANVAAHGVQGKIEMLVEPSRTALPRLLAAGRRFGLVFIDGDHSLAAASFDATWARSLVQDHGVIAFHDYHDEPTDSVTQALVSYGRPDELVERLAVYWSGRPT